MKHDDDETPIAVIIENPLVKIGVDEAFENFYEENKAHYREENDQVRNSDILGSLLLFVFFMGMLLDEKRRNPNLTPADAFPIVGIIAFACSTIYLFLKPRPSDEELKATTKHYFENNILNEISLRRWLKYYKKNFAEVYVKS